MLIVHLSLPWSNTLGALYCSGPTPLSCWSLLPTESRTTVLALASVQMNRLWQLLQGSLMFERTWTALFSGLEDIANTFSSVVRCLQQHGPLYRAVGFGM